MSKEVEEAFTHLRNLIERNVDPLVFPNTNRSMHGALDTIQKELKETAAVLSDLVQDHNTNWEVTSVKAVDENNYAVALTVRDRATALWFESQHRRGGDLKHKNLNNA